MNCKIAGTEVSVRPRPAGGDTGIGPTHVSNSAPPETGKLSPLIRQYHINN